MIETICEYSAFYYDSLVHQWDTMNPTKYGYMMIVIGIFGWLLMKNGANR